MLAHLRRLVDSEPVSSQKNLSREYLQARLLLALQQAGAMVCIAFHGGTALRFLFDLDRFSEDLDFALARDEEYELESWLRNSRRTLEKEGYDVEIRLDDERVVHSAWVQFPGLPHDLGWSTQPAEKLRIKLEVDTRPPEGAKHDVTLVRRHAVVRLFHHDRASLLGGKLHALLHRPYAKGRDFYDLAWYLSDRRWPGPNLDLLRNALAQTGWDGEEPTEENWRELVAERVEAVEWTQLRNDVEPFLERPEALQLVERDALLRLLLRP